MPKFFVNNNQISGKEITILGEDVNHILNVLRLDEGDELHICDIDSKNNYIAEIFDRNKDTIKCLIKDKINSDSESNIKINVFQGIPKSDKMELIIQKSVEIRSR